MEKIDTVVVGGGQAGVAMSEHLSKNDVPHVVLERYRIAERWRSERWDSLVANGPAWHDRFPNLEYSGISLDAFPTKDKIAEYFVEYAEMIKAPVRCGTEVLQVKKISGAQGFTIYTSKGIIEAKNVIAATGAFQQPIIPHIIPKDAEVLQIHSSEYRNPAQLPEGSVIVIGAGSSGVQIADELSRSGKDVYLSVGPHDRPPRRYRGRDFVWWLGVLGLWDLSDISQGKEHITIAVSGAHGGHTVDFRKLAAQGITLVGMSQKYVDGILYFANDLLENITNGDKNYTSMLDQADAYIAQNGLDFPEDPKARLVKSEVQCISNAVLKLDLSEVGIKSVIWATGFSQNYSWLDVDVFDGAGKPKHQRGITPERGIYFLGLPWQSNRGSSFIWGVWHDAKYLADHIISQRKYDNYGAPK